MEEYVGIKMHSIKPIVCQSTATPEAILPFDITTLSIKVICFDEIFNRYHIFDKTLYTHKAQFKSTILQYSKHTYFFSFIHS